MQQQHSADSIAYLDSLAIADSTFNFTSQRASLISQMNLLEQTISNLYLQRKAVVEGEVDAAEAINSGIVPAEVPETNDKVINQYYITFEKTGKYNLYQFYNDILAVATQCPFGGGKAVFRARNLISLYNDSIVYDDDMVCLQQGIYKETGMVQQSIKFKLIPNPADDFVKLELSGEVEGICKIYITNVFGAKIMSDEFNCNQRSYNISTASFTPGIYFVGVSFNGEKPEFNKLVIVR